MGLFSRAKKMLGSDEDERNAHDECWGRIVAIDSKLGPAIRLQIELHMEEQPLETAKLSTNGPLRRTPRVGEDVAITPVEHGYRIQWDKAPQYGIPTPTQEQLQAAILPGLPPESPDSTDSPTVPPELASIEAMRDAGQVSEADFQKMKANLLRPGEEIERLHDSGAMSDKIYANTKAAERRFAGGVEVKLPTPDEARQSLGHATDDSFELDLQRRGTSARATVVALPESMPDDRFQLRMPLDVEPEGGGTAYRVDCVFPAARPIDRLAVGIWLPIKVDPDDRERVAVVWNLWLADLGRPPRRG
jgi:hypothetical protein